MSSQEHWFNIDITLERDRGEGAGERPPPAVVRAASLRKPWSEFLRLHYLLLTDEFGCDEAVKEKLPAPPPGPPRPTSGGVAGVSSSSGGGGGTSSNESSYNSSISLNIISGSGSGSISTAEIAEGLDAYLKALLAIPAVVQSQVFSGFLEKSRGQRRADREEEEEEEERRCVGSAVGWRGSYPGWGCGGEARNRKSPETAIDFLLQPFEYSKVYLPRRAEHTESIDVLRGESVVWKFEVMDHLDIDFSVTFRPQPMVASSFSPPEAGDGGQSAAEARGAVHPEASPGPRGIGGGVPTTANSDSRRSGEAEGKVSRWWGRSGGAGCKRAVGCKSAVGAAGDEARGGEGGPVEQTVHLPTRYSTGGEDPVQGSFSCPAAGT